MEAPNTNWANRTVFTGDNLDVMRGMNSESVDLIYADPPFNSNRNYAAPIGSEAAGAAFKDTWTLSDIDVSWMGIIADQHPGVYKVIEAASVAHGKGMQSYLCMIGIRLLEMRRLLKETGSIYLHCDQTANSYLRILLDAIFASDQFRNEVVWHYDGPQRPSKRSFGTKHDTVLRYSKSDTFYSNPDGIAPARDLTVSELSKFKRAEDGRYYYTTPRGDYTDTSIAKLEADGRIEYTKNGNARVRYFLPMDSSGQVFRHKQLHDVWSDIVSLGHAGGNEKLGYPTQKPVALLERIITASTKSGDVVLDPFCGCATALVAAEKLTRHWVGFDISAMAVKLVRHRLYREVPLFTQDAIDRTDVPRRTDLVDEVREYQNDKHVLYGQQEGHCNGCGGIFEFRNLEVDHVVPRAKGGADHISNYQLLCGFCNRTKGTGSQAELLAKLKRDGIIAAA